MKLSQLRYFVAVCRFNNISKAAESLYVSQPAISSSIKELEAEFGLNLFHRKNNKLLLTMEGEFLKAKAELILASVDKLSNQMKDLGHNKNYIRIGIPPMIGTFLFPTIYREFKEQYPAIEIELVESGSLATIEEVEDDQVDLAIAVIDSSVKDRLNIVPILETELYYFVGRRHHLAACREVTFEMLRDEQLILMKTDSYQNAVIKSEFADRNITPKIIFYSSQLYTIKEFLKVGQAGAFLFKDVAPTSESIVGIPLKNPLKVSIGLAYKKNSQLYTDAACFVRFIKKYGGKFSGNQTRSN